MPERRTAIRARRKQLADMRMPTFKWPDYLVTAPHTAPAPAGDRHPRLPYGEWHARKVGSLQAACGRSAVNWHFFWTLDFTQAGLRACGECVRTLAAAEPH